MTRRRMAATVAAGSLYVLAGWTLWMTLQLVAIPTLDALLEHNGLPTISRPAQEPAPIGDEPTGYEQGPVPAAPGRTAAPQSAVIRPMTAEVPPSSSGPEPLRGIASWVHAGLGDRYLAARMPKGTGLRICGALGCVTRIVVDYGPSKRKHPGRIVDLSRADFARVCGHPETLGTCPVRVRVLGRIAPPETSTEGEP